MLAQTAGVASKTLAEHSLPARALVYTIGLSLLFVTFPLAALGMAVYASANLVSPEWSDAMRWGVVAAAALGWACLVTFGIDRTLLVLADAVDPQNRFARGGMLALRLGIAALLSSLVAEEIILWRYRAPIAEAAQQLSIASREATSRQLRGIHGVDAKEQAANAADAALATLRSERAVLPEAVVALQASATRCGRERDALNQRYAALRVRAQEDSAQAPALAALAQRAADKRRECGKLLNEAGAAKATYLAEKDRAIAEASTQAKDAASTLNNTRQALDQEQHATGASTAAAWRDGSSREAAFAKVKAERADIRRTAGVLWAALLLLELLPLLLKLFASNNPVAVAIGRQLHDESAKERMKSAQTAQMESLWVQTLAGDGATQDAVKQILALHNAAAPLTAFDYLLQQNEETTARLRRQADAVPGSEIQRAFLEAQAAAFERLSKSYA